VFALQKSLVRRQLEGHSNSVSTVAFLPDDKQAALASNDDTAI